MKALLTLLILRVLCPMHRLSGKATRYTCKCFSPLSHQQNSLNEDKTTLEFTPEELDGMPADFLENLPKSADNSKYIVSLKYPELFPVLKQVTYMHTQKQLVLTYFRTLIG